MEGVHFLCLGGALGGAIVGLYQNGGYDESTQVRNLSGLTSLGSADEVGEIIIDLQTNVPAANRLLRKAVEAKLAFSGSDLVEFAC